MSRSIWKGVYRKRRIGEIVERDWTIFPIDIGKEVIIKRGIEKENKKIKITEKQIGKKFGELNITKKPAIYKRKSKKR